MRKTSATATRWQNLRLTTEAIQGDFVETSVRLLRCGGEIQPEGYCGSINRDRTATIASLFGRRASVLVLERNLLNELSLRSLRSVCGTYMLDPNDVQHEALGCQTETQKVFVSVDSK